MAIAPSKPRVRSLLACVAGDERGRRQLADGVDDDLLFVV
jgi:hypothetical protein